MKNKRHIMLLLGYLLSVLIILPTTQVSDVFAARKDCSTETDSGKRMKCKTENLNEAVDELITTVLDDQTGTFTPNQKKQLQNAKNHGRNETDRIKPEDFKQLSKKRKKDCYIQEILGDVDPANDLNDNGECDGLEICIGNEDGICNKDEQKIGGCAEVLNDGIGDDDGVCVDKGKYKEACIEVCDTEIIMAEGDESNVDSGKAAEMEQNLINATDIVDESSTKIKDFVQARAVEASSLTICDKDSMMPCEYLKCLLDKGRTSSSKTIEDLTMSAISLQAIADTCRDVGDQTWVVLFGSVDARIACLPLGLAANGVSIVAQMLEVVDDSETADRVDATALCAQDTGDQVNQLNELVELTKYLLQQPQGQRGGFQEK